MHRLANKRLGVAQLESVPESVTVPEPVLTIGSKLAAQGGMSETFKGTLDGVNIIIKKISPTVEWAWRSLKNEINISAKLKRELDACSPESDIICYMGYAANTFYAPNDIEKPLIKRKDIQMNTFLLFYRDVGGPELFDTIGEPPGSPLYKNPTERMAILTKILMAIQKLHDRDIVHLDIKPENIMLTPTGNPVLIDLGFACSTDEATLYSCNTTDKKGSKPYAAPEFLKNDPTSLNTLKKADIYSLGVTIFYVLTGLEFVRFNRDSIPYTDPAMRLSKPTTEGGGGFNISIKELVNRMVSINPVDRPTIDQVLTQWKLSIGTIRIAFVRHAISCSNALRMRNDRFGAGLYLNALSTNIKDAPLSEKGEQLAQAYSPTIQGILQGYGFVPATTTYAASSLRRAQQTLQLLFQPESAYILPHLKETGAVLENQPAETSGLLGFTDKRQRTAVESTIIDHGDWRAFTTWLKANLADPIFIRDADGNINLVIVGHGSYLRDLYAQLHSPTKNKREIFMNNMDCFIIESTMGRTTFEFKLVKDMILAPLVLDEDVRTNKCPAGGVDYPRLYIPENPIITPDMRAALNKLNVDFLTGLGIPASIPLHTLVDNLGSSYTLYDDLERFNPDITIRTLFIKLYDCVKRVKQWPPAGYTGPPTYLIKGYFTEPFNDFALRILETLGTTAAPSRTVREVYQFIKDAKDKNQAIRTLLGLVSGSKSTEFPDYVIRAGEIVINKILYNKDPRYDRFLGPITNSNDYNDYLVTLDREGNTVEYQDLFYGMDHVLSRLDQKLTDYNAQFFTVIDKLQTTDHFIQGKMFEVTPSNGKTVITEFITDATNGDLDSMDNSLQLPVPKKKLVKETTYIKFKYTFIPNLQFANRVGIIQGFKLHEYPDIAAALFLAPPVEMSEHAKTRLNTEWKITDSDSDEAKGKKIKEWVLKKTGLTEYQFSQKYQHILNNFQMQDRKLLFTDVADNKLNMLEVRSRISPTAVCGEILKKAAGGDDTAGQLKEVLGGQIKSGIFGTCPTKKQFQDAFNTVRTEQGLQKMTFVDDLVALRDIALTKLEKSVDMYDEFKRWLLAYNNTKRTANTSLFIPQIIELGSSIKSPLVSSTPFTVGYWRTEFTEKLSQIISLLKGDLPARIRSKIAEGRNTKIIEAMPAALQARLPATREELSDADKAVLNLPANLDVVANLNEIDPKLAVQEVQNAPFQLKYVKNPNPAGIKVSDALKPIKSAGWFSSAQYPSKQSIKSTLGAVRDAFGLPTEHAQDLTRILKFAKSPRAIDKKIFEKIEAYKDLHPEIDLSAIKKTSWGYPPPKKDMITKIESAMVATPRKLIQELSYSGSLGPRGAAGVGSSAAQPQSPIMGSKLNTTPQPQPQSQNDNQPHLLGGARIKTTAPTRKMKQRQQQRKQQKQQKQRGGGSPLAFFQEGAQMHGTYGSETGAGLGLMTDSMARSAITQTGGRKNRTRKQQQRQRGGFSPGLMGSFAVNGLSLLPVAGYMSYKMMKGNKSRKEKRGATGRKRQTRRN